MSNIYFTAETDMPEQSQVFEFQAYANKTDTKGRPMQADNFRAFVEHWANARNGRPTHGQPLIDDKDGPLVGHPKINPTKGRTKDNLRPGAWCCLDLDHVPGGYIEALKAHAFPNFLCAVWRTHSWSFTDRRTRAVFALSSAPKDAASYAATVRALYASLNGLLIAAGFPEAPALDDESCCTVSQCQYTTPTGRVVEMFGGVPFDPVEATPEPDPVIVRDPDQYADRPPVEFGDAYAKAALQAQCAWLAGLTEGEKWGRHFGRNAALNVSACKLYGFVAANRLDAGEVDAALMQACYDNGLAKEKDGERACRATIRSGADKGFQTPNFSGLPKQAVAEDFEARPSEPSEHPAGGSEDSGKAPTIETAHRWQAVPIAQHAFDILADIENEPAPLSTGLVGFDELLKGGFPSYGLFVLGAAPATGKTALALNVAVNVAHAGHAALFISCEMARSELFIRTLCQLSGTERLTQAQVEKGIKEEKTECSAPWAAFCKASPNLYIEELEDPTIEAIAYMTRCFAEQCAGKRPIVFVDYLQLIRARDPKRGEENKNRDTVTRLSYVARELKKMSKVCPVVVISSINREGYKGAPSMESLKACGDIEFSADWAGILTYSDNAGDAQQQADAEEKELMLVTVKGRRWRNGAKAYFSYYGPSYQFSDAPAFPDLSVKADQPTTPAKSWADMTDEERRQYRENFYAKK